MALAIPKGVSKKPGSVHTLAALAEALEIDLDNLVDDKKPSGDIEV
jgi:hypothetical protein